MSVLSVESPSANAAAPWPLPRVAGRESWLRTISSSTVAWSERILERQGGWDVAFAGNGVEALAAMERELPHIVLTDLQMPQMDGLALVEQIREKYPEVPVVLMTRSGSEEIAVQALRSGAASYVPKRNLAADLVPTLQQVLAASRIDRQRLRRWPA